MSIYSGGSRSVISKRSSTPSSILKKKGSLKFKFNNFQNIKTKVRFELPHSKKISAILHNYIECKLSKEYESLICLIRDAELLDEDVSSLLKEVTDCIPILNQDLTIFVEALLTIKWNNRNDNVVAEYQKFVVNLLCAHNYHARFVINKLVFLFLPDSSDTKWPDGVPSDDDRKSCSNIHSVFNILLTVVPLCKDLFIKALYNNFPYFTKSVHHHEYYVNNLLWILEYQPKLRQEIFHLLFSKLIILDVNAPREEVIRLNSEEDDEIFTMDMDTRSTIANQNNALTISERLDVSLDIIYNYFLKECENNGEINFDKLKLLYQDFLTIFDKIILPTYDIHYVQFTMFLLCSRNQALTEAFLNYLWKKVCNPSVAAVLRQSAISYIASLVARAKYVSLAMLKATLKQMADWIHSYISAQDGVESVNADVRIHSVFYSICQALFYLMVFRHSELVAKKKNIVFLESLNVAKIITCPLNPLKVCQSAIVQKFAAMTRKYQLAYCYSVIEHNARNTIPTVYQNDKGTLASCNNNAINMVFPFDPYILKISGNKIQEHYREYSEKYEGNSQDEVENNGEIDDDFLYQQNNSAKSSSYKKFSYGSSPGFKFK